MPSWVTVLIIAIGGAMLIEGSAYALFPKGMKRAMREILEMPENQLKNGGLIVAMIGLVLIVLLVPRL